MPNAFATYTVSTSFFFYRVILILNLTWIHFNRPVEKNLLLQLVDTSVETAYGKLIDCVVAWTWAEWLIFKLKLVSRAAQTEVSHAAFFILFFLVKYRRFGFSRRRSTGYFDTAAVHDRELQEWMLLQRHDAHPRGFVWLHSNTARQPQKRYAWAVKKWQLHLIDTAVAWFKIFGSRHSKKIENILCTWPAPFGWVGR